MLDTVDFNHVQHISFTQSRLTDAVSVILSESLSYEHPPKSLGHLRMPLRNGRVEQIKHRATIQGEEHILALSFSQTATSWTIG